VTEESAARLGQVALLGEAAECVAGVAIFVWDEDRNYVAVNEAACELLGRSRAEILKMKVGDMTADRAAPYFEAVQRGHGPHSGTLRVDLAEGVLEIEWVNARTTIAGLPYMVSVCRRKEPA
jgi:PAS domain S-box-containing protein